jgi:hypothetical protein
MARAGELGFEVQAPPTAPAVRRAHARSDRCRPCPKRPDGGRARRPSPCAARTGAARLPPATNRTRARGAAALGSSMGTGGCRRRRPRESLRLRGGRRPGRAARGLPVGRSGRPATDAHRWRRKNGIDDAAHATGLLAINDHTRPGRPRAGGPVKQRLSTTMLRLVCVLREYFHSSAFRPGCTARSVLADDDLEIEVTISVRRRMTPEEASELREAALAAAAAEPWRVAGCNCHLARPRLPWSRSLPQCEGRIVVAAVAYRRLRQDQPEFASSVAATSSATGSPSPTFSGSSSFPPARWPSCAAWLSGRATSCAARGRTGRPTRRSHSEPLRNAGYDFARDPPTAPPHTRSCRRSNSAGRRGRAVQDPLQPPPQPWQSSSIARRPCPAVRTRTGDTR